MRGRLAMVLALAAAPSLAAAQEKTMTTIIPKAEQKTVAGSPENFTGRVTITGQFQREAPSRVGGALVHFEPGARTAWHTHPLGQTLIVIEGVGRTQVEDGPVLESRAGDVLLCPADRRHWHGATPTTAMTHLAVQESENGSPVTWMEHVSDDYRKGPSR